METKTPVSALQEYCVSTKTVPVYELVLITGKGTHNPEFIYRVHVGSVSEDGKGKSKQEAKHRAAIKILKTLNLEKLCGIGPTDELDDSGYDTENRVGQLKDYCLSKCYPSPEFMLEEEAGPPHCKIFKMICKVSGLKEYGISKTKKQAKHIAAYEMLERLKKLPKDHCNSIENESDDQNTCHGKTYIKIPPKTITMEEVVKKQNAIKYNLMAPTSKEPVVFYKDQQKAYLGLEKESQNLEDILRDNSLLTIVTAYDTLSKITEELGVTLTQTTGGTKNGMNIIFLGLDGGSEWPKISGFGDTVDAAALDILKSLSILCVE